MHIIIITFTIIGKLSSPCFSNIPPVVAPILKHSILSHRNLDSCPFELPATLEVLKLSKQGLPLYFKLTLSAIGKLDNKTVQIWLNMFPTGINSALRPTTQF